MSGKKSTKKCEKNFIRCVNKKLECTHRKISEFNCEHGGIVEWKKFHGDASFGA